MYAIIETPQLSDGDETRRIRLRPCVTGRYFADDDAQSSKHRRPIADNRQPTAHAEACNRKPGTRLGAIP
jgi:hypothetical protein